MEQLHLIGERWSLQLNKKPKAEQLLAKVERLNFAGHMATIDALADGDPLRYEEAERLPISVALFKLTYSMEVALYQERLYEVMRKSKK